MRRGTVEYTFRRNHDKRRKPETASAECVQFADGNIYLHGDIVEPLFSSLQDLEKALSQLYDSYQINWVDPEEAGE